ncbi:hypothetical protein GMRT_fx009 [Giardia muris]|uniref:LSM domain-containing protein n=1 Tax=Giardia muris TaxID=5742 RepID=A0A4Z1SQD9_GIAMU|nr:hypothetical protein GMRT_fx009 [Giardia muris]|eukprot:TNJ27890.1 hypothetical protein GMRT_fx009 [Giardia muris]
MHVHGTLIALDHYMNIRLGKPTVCTGGPGSTFDGAAEIIIRGAALKLVYPAEGITTRAITDDIVRQVRQEWVSTR